MKNGDGKHDQQARVGSLLAFVFALPIDGVSRRQFDLLVYFLDGLFDCAAEVAAAHAVFDGNVAAIAFAIDLPNRHPFR